MAAGSDEKMDTNVKDQGEEDVDEEEEEDDTESESEEEVEPKLKYERIANDLTQILSKDAASCIAVHTKFLALGTHWGMIFILDHSGNNIRDKEIMAHTTTVNQISIDEKGEYLASCSDDGKVIIAGLYGTEQNQTVSFDRPVKAVGIDPDFSKHGKGRQFVIGEERLVLNEKGGLFRSNKSTIVHQGEGPVRNIKWRGEFIAWANNIGVRVWDTNARCLITRIDKDHGHRPELYVCQLMWKDDRTLLVGWADQVKVCVVRDQRGSADTHDLPRRYVEIKFMFKTDFFVCGIAPMGHHLVVLSYDLDGMQQEAGRMVCKRPHLQIIDPGMNTCEEISNDALSIRGFEEYRVSDYHLECMPDENLFFVVSPKDVVLAKLRDMDDHISWLMEHERYEEAMACASDHENDLKTHSYEAIGRAYLDYLLEEKKFLEAVKMCPKILQKRKDLWEDEIIKFAKIGQLKAIAVCIPTSDPVLSPHIYEMVLHDFLQSDYSLFYQLIKTWPHEHYDKEVMVNAVVGRLDRDPDQELLIQSLGQLYAYQKAFDKALAIYLRLKNKDVFALIQKHQLYSALNDQIKPLMALDSEQATKLLLDNMDKIPVDKVVRQLTSAKRNDLLFVYLDHLFSKDMHAASDYGGLMVELYAEFDRSKLLAFLRRSESYPLQKASEICQARGFIKEQVFLLGRMGNLIQALKMIMEGLADVNHAIEFCKEQNDEELWENLITYSMDKPPFITALLHNVGADIDPIKIISRIQNKLSIPGLRDSLVKILQDYNLQISLREGCRKILVADSFNLLERMVRTQRKAIFLDDFQTCPVCAQQVLVNDIRFASNLVVFHCRHTFHEDCLPVAVTCCTICSSQKRSPGSKQHFAA